MKKLLLSLALMLSGVYNTTPPSPIKPIYIPAPIPNIHYQDYYREFISQEGLTTDKFNDVMKIAAIEGTNLFLNIGPSFVLAGAPLGAMLAGLEGARNMTILCLAGSTAISVGAAGISLGIGTTLWHNKFMNKNLPNFKAKTNYHNFLRLGDNDLNIA